MVLPANVLTARLPAARTSKDALNKQTDRLIDTKINQYSIYQ